MASALPVVTGNISMPTALELKTQKRPQNILTLHEAERWKRGICNMGKGKRTRRTSSGARKLRALRTLGHNVVRSRVPVVDVVGQAFLKAQKRDRWPTEAQMIKMHELTLVKRPRANLNKKIKPMNTGFLLLDGLIGTCPKVLNTVLMAASLKLKRVHRYPGWILQQTYNLHNRPLTFI